MAAGVTYYGLLALFPGLAALVSVYGLFADPARFRRSQYPLRHHAGRRARGRRRAGQASRIEGGGPWLGSSRPARSLWSANQAEGHVRHAQRGLRRKGEARLPPTHPDDVGLHARCHPQSLAMAAVIVLPVVLDFLGLSSTLEGHPALARWPILAASSLWRSLPSFTASARAAISRGGSGCPGQRVARALARGRCVLLVRGQLRQLQRDLRLARRRDRVHDLDLDLRPVVLSAQRSTPRWSTRPLKTPPRARSSRWAAVEREWPTPYGAAKA